MLWSTQAIQRMLDLYLQQPLLWDPKHALFGDKAAREKALETVAGKIGIYNVTADDINRKYRSMRAAYRVEVRKIHGAGLRGFFYKPSLHWFPIFKQYMKDIEDLKVKSFDTSEQLKLQGSTLVNNQYIYSINDPKLSPEFRSLQTSAKQEEQMEMEEESHEEDYSSEESEDEFQSFADHIAEQLRNMSVHRAVMIQNKIQRIFANDREAHEEMYEDEEEEEEEM